MTASFSAKLRSGDQPPTTDVFAVETAPTGLVLVLRLCAALLPRGLVLALKATRGTAFVGAVLTASFSSEAALSYYNRVIC